MGSKAKTLAEHLAGVPDPRKVRGQRHVLLNIILIAILRHITLNMLRQDPNTKGSIRHRRLKAALSQEYRLAALLGFPTGSASDGHGPADQKTMPPSSQR